MSHRRPRLAVVAPLRVRDFRLLWIGMTVSLLGDGVFLVAIAWQVYQLSNAPTALAAVGLAMSLSQVVVLLLGGVASDRFDRRRVMIAADLLRAAVIGLLGLLALTGRLHLWHLFVLGAVYGLGAGFFGPAFDAIVPDLIPEDVLAPANSVDQILRPVALRLAGPAVGGWLIAAGGTGGAFLLDAGSFLVSAAMLARMAPRVHHTADAAPASALREIREGFGFVRQHIWLWGTFLAATFAYLLFMGPTEVLVPFIVKHYLAGSASDLGLVFAVGGLGAVAGAFLVGQRGYPRRHISFMYVAWSLATLAVAGYGLATRTWQLMLASLAFNALEAAGTVVWATTKQRLVPAALLGRVSSLDWFISIGLLPVSFAITGPVAAAVGPRATLIGAGVLGAAVTLGALFLPGMRSVERGRLPVGERRGQACAGTAAPAPGPAMTEPATTDAPAPEQAIRDLLEQLNQGFARRDVAQVLHLFAPGPETVFIGSEAGEIAAGPTGLRNLLEALFARPEIYHWRWGEHSISIAGHTAWLAAQAILVVEGPQPLELPYRMTLVLQRSGATWLIVHYHGSEPTAVPEPVAGTAEATTLRDLGSPVAG